MGVLLIASVALCAQDVYFPEDDNCNTCACTEDGPSCTEEECPAGDDCGRLETRYATRDAAGYLKMVRKKLPKLRRAAEDFAVQQPDISSHTNFQQAAISLTGCVQAIQELLDAATASE